jgi:hypothetical protein
LTVKNANETENREIKKEWLSEMIISGALANGPGLANRLFLIRGLDEFW